MGNTSHSDSLLKSAFGSVRPYTRHLAGCKSKNNSCRCPKWLYENRPGGKRRRYTLNTPSWAEAQRIATNRLRSLDPDIAAAQATLAESNAKLVTIEVACQMWLDRDESQSTAWTLSMYRSAVKMLKEWAERHRVEYVQDITPGMLQTWYTSADWKHYAQTSKRQRWVVYRSMFRFWTEREVIEKNPIFGIRPVKLNGDMRQGPYTETQIAAIFAATQKIDVAETKINVDEKQVYASRLHAFITLLLNTGCDVIDAVLFDKANLKAQKVGKRTVFVYRYDRVKTGKPAVIPMTDEVGSTLLDTPMLKCNPEGMPFRCDRRKQWDVQVWQYRVNQVLSLAGVEQVELPRGKDGSARYKDANLKMFRHTFAVRSLVAGQREEIVARMLGHSDTQMIRAHYGAWEKERDEALVTEVVGNW